eukprot:m.610144 g.610144  ORF g.610144 m.610144 type:complete len:349 (+) comp58131_c0_seq2:77-1123(+)
MIDINRNIRTFAAGLLAVFVLFFLILSSGLHHSLEASGTGEEHIDLIELLSASINLAERGGRIVRSVREGGLLDQSSKGQTAEGADDPLTRADTTSHKEIVKARSARGLAAALRRRRSATPTEATSLPNKRLLPKLSPARVPMSEVTVWVDPLNVTQEFTENLLQYVTVLVCISNQGKPVGAVIHQPFPDGEGKVHTVYALSGVQGVSLLRGNSSSVHESSTARRVIVSRSHSGAVESTVRKAFASDVTPPVVIPAGGAGYKSLQVLQGAADAYVHVTKIKKWDFCAGDSVLRAAGGRMTDMFGKEFNYDRSTDPVNPNGLIGARTLATHAEFVAALTDEFQKLSGAH